MNQLQTLSDALCDLLKQIEGTDIRLIIGGGFGIYLKAEHIRKLDAQTLIDPQFWPEARSTNDLDLFLRPELLVDSARLKALAQAISDLDYKPVPGAEKYQFIKPAGGGREAATLKIDILTGPRAAFSKSNVRVDDRRVRPRPSVGLHAHPVDEAPTLERNLLPVTVSGTLSSGEPWTGEVFLPHPFTFAMMKLFAFRDRLKDRDQEKAQYHALDVYSIVATTTEEEWKQALMLRDEFQQHPFVIEAAHIAHEYFARPEQMGLIRLQESRYYRDDFNLRDFSSVLLELFPLPTS